MILSILALVCIGAVFSSACILIIIIVSFRSVYFLNNKVDPINSIKFRVRKTEEEKRSEEALLREKYDILA